MQTTIDFLTSVLPTAKHYAALFRTAVGFKQRPVTSVEELARQTVYASSEGTDVYFGLSGFERGWHVPTGKDKEQFRTHDNAVAQKALWLDVDVGKASGRSYGTQKEAIVALHAFVKATGLPVPTIVSSGHGVHLYWILQDQIVTETWRKLASILDALVKHYGFIADSTRTMDPSSVLRVPGTWNYSKPGEDRPVKILLNSPVNDNMELGKALVTAMKAAGVTPTQTRVHTAPVKPVVNPVLKSFPGLVDNFKTDMTELVADRDPKAVIKGCRQIQMAGTDVEPVWFNMMSVMKYCVDGEKWVHKISALDTERYDEATTQQKFEYAKEIGGAPTRCDTFASHSPEKCKGCPARGKITSPVELGAKQYNIPKVVELKAPNIVETDDGTGLIVNPPTEETLEVEPFRNAKFMVVPGKGTIYRKTETLDNGDEVTKDIVMNRCEFYVPCYHRYYDPAKKMQERVYVVRKVLEGQSEDLLLPMDVLLGQGTVLRWMGNHGALPESPNFFKLQEEFMSAYIAAIQHKAQPIYVKETFGWTTTPCPDSDATQRAFIVGSTIYSEETKPLPVNLGARCSSMLETEFITAGNLNEWKEAVDMYRVLDQKEAQFGICAGFAAPLMKFGTGTAVNSIINFWEPEGGRGKSTMFQFVNSIWGHPTHLMCSATDTQSGRFQTIAARRNLPVCMDEMTMVEEKMAAELLYTLANGRDKRKSNQSGTSLMNTGQWETIILMNSNESWYEKMVKYSPGASAPTMRIMDIRWKANDIASDRDTLAYISAMTNKVTKNYGLAGRVFMEKVLKTKGLLDKLPDMISNFDQKYRVNADERFWTHGIGAVIVAGRIAKAIGLINFDLDALEEWAIATMLPGMRHKVRAQKVDPVTLLSDFLEDNLDSTLIVMSGRRPAGMPASDNVILDHWVRKIPQRELSIRHELDTDTIIVRTQALREWCRRRNVSEGMLLEALTHAGIYEGNEKGRKQQALASGVATLDRARSMCFEFKGSILKQKGVI